MTTANPIRGEADITIGRESFRVAVTFSGLTKLSQATKVLTLDDLYRRLIGFEPFAVACAVRTLIVADDDDKASALAARILDDSNISMADRDSWQDGIEKAFLAHVEGGHRHRDERSSHEMAEAAILGEQGRPS